MPHIGPWDYAMPVYQRVMLYAYMHRFFWKNHRGQDPEAVAHTNYRQVDLGRVTGKTTAIVKFMEDHEGCILVCQTVELANRISRRHPGVRAFGVDEIKQYKTDRFTSSDPMFIFDDVSCRNVVEVVARFKPERFVHIGLG